MSAAKRANRGRCAAVITGAGSGIGAAIASQLAGDGYAVGLLDVDVVAAEAVAAKVRGNGADAVAVAADVADERSVQAAAEEVVGRLGVVDVLVNNAGIQHVAPFAELTAAAWRRVIDVDLTSVFLVTRAFLPSLADGGGVVVNVGSLGGQLGIPERSAYSAAKGGVAAMTRSLAVDLAGHGVRVNCIAPGPVPTALNDGGRTSRPTGQTPTGLRGRMGEVGDIAAVVSFLASGASRHVNGVVLPVDGGASAVFAG